MLASFKSSSSSSEDATENPPPPPPPPLCLASSSAATSAAHHLRRLLFTAADFISQSNVSAAQNILSILTSNSSPYGDSTERLVHLFTKALSVRIGLSENAATWTTNEMTSSTVLRAVHLTANQAILDATETNNGNGALHILDLDISQGLQWPPLMQALAERSSSNPSSTPPPSLRITGCGRDVTVLNRTGDRLTRFANSLGLQFQFHTLVIAEEDLAGLLLQIRLLALSAVQGESIAVNCVHFLHRFFNDAGDMIGHFLSAIKSLNPRIVTMAERSEPWRSFVRE
ncbi:hypothetical protein Bca52824_033202 [Brassica carinata]|uniref:Uncharacterized protein n=1 Tax=Brassica carinata TaxID=52824 RepID=A0A8X7V988_BRACI|nr:hypothetical protein Bca52824_033202 [Brassica carinata]